VNRELTRAAAMVGAEVVVYICAAGLCPMTSIGSSVCRKWAVKPRCLFLAQGPLLAAGLLAAARWVTVNKPRYCQPAIIDCHIWERSVNAGFCQWQAAAIPGVCDVLRRSRQRRRLLNRRCQVGLAIQARASFRHACAIKSRSVSFPIFITLMATNLEVGVWLPSPKLPNGTNGFVSG